MLQSLDAVNAELLGSGLRHLKARQLLAPLRVALPADSVDEADLVEASPLPLTAAERRALIAVSLPPVSDQQACASVELPAEWAEAVKAARMDSLFDCLNILMVPRNEVAAFLHELLNTGSATLYEYGHEALYAQFLRAAQSALDASDVELARFFQVSHPTIGRWTRGYSAPHPLARKAVVKGLAIFAAERAPRRRPE